MINLFKKYWEYIFFVFTLLIVSAVGYVYYENNNSVVTPTVEKLAVSKKEEKTSESEVKKTVFVDVKGAVNAPGVYELDSERRVIDAINLAGGLQESANTINLNLSKKVSDEMYIVVYTKKQLEDFKKQNNSKEISCVAGECICPDKQNSACIGNNSKDVLVNKSESSDKISINAATKEDLINLPSIGDAKADAIIKYRNENGNFKQLEDIKNVSGIGDSIYEKIKDKITL